MYTYIEHMSQIISISDDVYNVLKKMKGKESYSVVIRKLIHKTSNKEKILKFFGSGGIDNKKLKELNKMWGKWTEEYA